MRNVEIFPAPSQYELVSHSGQIPTNFQYGWKKAHQPNRMSQRRLYRTSFCRNGFAKTRKKALLPKSFFPEFRPRETFFFTKTCKGCFAETRLTKWSCQNSFDLPKLVLQEQFCRDSLYMNGFAETRFTETVLPKLVRAVLLILSISLRAAHPILPYLFQRPSISMCDAHPDSS